MFLLVPAHPGFPGQNPQSRKTVVLCVCVCMCVTMSNCYSQAILTFPRATVVYSVRLYYAVMRYAFRETTRFKSHAKFRHGSMKHESFMK